MKVARKTYGHIATKFVRISIWIILSYVDWCAGVVSVSPTRVLLARNDKSVIESQIK